jgi:hypothetical protein
VAPNLSWPSARIVVPARFDTEHPMNDVLETSQA